MTDQTPKITFLSLEGDIFKQVTGTGKVSVEAYDKATGTFKDVSDSFTGRDLFDAHILIGEEIPIEVRLAAGL